MALTRLCTWQEILRHEFAHRVACQPLLVGEELIEPQEINAGEVAQGGVSWGRRRVAKMKSPVTVVTGPGSYETCETVRAVR